MHVDTLVAEIGSTTTVVSAFMLGEGEPAFLGQGQAPTTVLEGDVRVGLEQARGALCRALGAKELSCSEMLATSSAAGGLRMSVHGLVYDMTVRAAEAAALGAGAVVRGVTAGKMTEQDALELKRLHPNLILLAGGTDYGERETAVHNAGRIAALGMGDVPVIYAGNIQSRSAVRDVLEGAGIPVYITENVYPRLDELNIEPARRVIQAVFEEHIVKAPGMEHIRDMVTGPILPTPGAVMEAARLLQETLGDLVAVDVGGATTDVHSVAEGAAEIAAIQTRAEPFAKRTVEGDLGLYVNAKNLIDLLGQEKLSRELGLDVEAVLARYKPIPESPEQLALTERLCLEAGLTALRRHTGTLRHIYLPEGRRTVAEGKDLSQVKALVATGGALTRLAHRESILRQMADCNKSRMMLFPAPGALRVLVDHDYIMAALGVLSRKYPRAALALLLKSLGCEYDPEV